MSSGKGILTRFGGERPPERGPGAAGAAPGRRGRPPKLVRESYRMAFADQLEFLKKVVRCDPSVKRKVWVVAANGKRVQITVEPTIAERIRAVEVMGKFSGVATLRAEDETPEPLTPSGYDLTKLTVEELQRFEELLNRAEQPRALLTTATGVEVHQHDQHEEEDE